ncbi:MAG: class I mannose-6-phosphate isomerase [Spirochaetales bacterium]|nr:class I mannose-6-phosphate isomerase [Spirochaetales bacterium]
MEEKVSELFPANYPIKILSTRVWRQYLGGMCLDEFLSGEKREDDHFPEDWIGSTVRAINPGRENIEEGESIVLSPIDGVTKINLRELLEQKGVDILGEEHCEKIGKEPGILVKLLDSAVRLAIQTHPSKENALKYFGSKYGKTESWYILDTRTINGEKPYVYLGFKENVTKEAWREAFLNQDIDRMLSMLHKLPVKKGDVFFVRYGIPHAIGPGCFVCEVQEPSDLIFKTELKKIDGSPISLDVATMGLGTDEMLNNFDYTGLSEEETLCAYKIEPKVIFKNEHASFTQLLGYDTTTCFSINQLDLSKGSVELQGGLFNIAIVIEGKGEVKGREKAIEIKKGDYILLPKSLDSVIWEGQDLSVIICSPPLL